MSPSKHVVAAIDDDRRVRESIRSVLESAGYEPEMFGSAEEFLDSGVLTRASCVIADVRLPGIDGIELQRRIRTQHPPAPVILITAHDDDGVREKALQGGAVAFLLKPFDAADLLDHIERSVKSE
jgi:FixJ family two-component response regulator